MAPRVPDEIDVFTVPHSRMKELVNIYTQKMECVDFRDGPEVMSLLRGLGSTLQEFKSHETIENIFIMDQLKNRLKQRKISNAAVCDCHADNRLADVVQVMKTGVGVKQSVRERLKFGLRLQRAFHDFVNNFLPHMEEEEQVFQPLLVEHFEYEELKILKEVVLKEHEIVKELGQEKGQQEALREGEVCEDLKDLRDLDCLHLDELSNDEDVTCDTSWLSESTSPGHNEEEDERDRDELEIPFDREVGVPCGNSQRLDTFRHDIGYDTEDTETRTSHDPSKVYLQDDSFGPEQAHLNEAWELSEPYCTESRIWNNRWNVNDCHDRQLLDREPLHDSQESFRSELLLNENLNEQTRDLICITNEDYEEDQQCRERQEPYSCQLDAERCCIEDSIELYTQKDQTSILPGEVLIEIFRHLTPLDLCRCAQVSRSWNAAVFTPVLWSALYPVQWSRGIWVNYNIGLGGALEEAVGRELVVRWAKWDEDADVDEAEDQPDPLAAQELAVFQSLVMWVLPRVGCGVTTLVVEAGRGITSRLLHHALRLCPALRTLVAAHTLIDSYAFKGVWLSGGLRRLRHLDLQGCHLVDDVALTHLALCGPTQYNAWLRAREQYFDPHQSHHCSCLHMSAMRSDTCACAGCHCLLQQYPSSEYRYVMNRQSLKRTGMFDLHDINATETDIEEIHCHSKSSDGREVMAVASHCGKRVYQIPDCLDFSRETEHGCSDDDQWPGDFTKRTGDRQMPDFSRHDIQERRHERRWSGLELLTLNLSGCWRVTDTGLGALARAGAVSGLTSLDVSGCYRLSGRGLGALASACPALRPDNLWYCDNIQDGPYPLQANGCANLGNPVRACCRSGR